MPTPVPTPLPPQQQHQQQQVHHTLSTAQVCHLAGMVDPSSTTTTTTTSTASAPTPLPYLPPATLLALGASAEHPTRPQSPSSLGALLTSHVFAGEAALRSRVLGHLHGAAQACSAASAAASSALDSTPPLLFSTLAAAQRVLGGGVGASAASRLEAQRLVESLRSLCSAAECQARVAALGAVAEACVQRRGELGAAGEAVKGAIASAGREVGDAQSLVGRVLGERAAREEELKAEAVALGGMQRSVGELLGMQAALRERAEALSASMQGLGAALAAEEAARATAAANAAAAATAAATAAAGAASCAGMPTPQEDPAELAEARAALAGYRSLTVQSGWRVRPGSLVEQRFATLDYVRHPPALLAYLAAHAKHTGIGGVAVEFIPGSGKGGGGGGG
jgi:hypothetical protein